MCLGSTVGSNFDFVCNGRQYNLDLDDASVQEALTQIASLIDSVWLNSNATFWPNDRTMLFNLPLLISGETSKTRWLLWYLLLWTMVSKCWFHTRFKLAQGLIVTATESAHDRERRGQAGGFSPDTTDPAFVEHCAVDAFGIALSNLVSRTTTAIRSKIKIINLSAQPAARRLAQTLRLQPFFVSIRHVG